MNDLLVLKTITLLNLLFCLSYMIMISCLSLCILDAKHRLGYMEGEQLTILMEMFTYLLEFPCYIGSVLTFMLVINLLRMGSLKAMTFVNKMFLIYFSVDLIVGLIQDFSLFKLGEKRFVLYFGS